MKKISVLVLLMVMSIATGFAA
ncbi:hypothetical protein EZS27_039684, partial [termite gut metagenome]